jgi:hypothetical protein
MRLHVAAVALSASLAMLGTAADAVALEFAPFVTSGAINTALGQDSTIGFAYLGNKFVGSVYIGTNNSQLYSTDLTGGTVQKFSSPIAGFSGEVDASASLGLGGYGPRDVLAGAENGGARCIAFEPRAPVRQPDGGGDQFGQRLCRQQRRRGHAAGQCG